MVFSTGDRVEVYGLTHENVVHLNGTKGIVVGNSDGYHRVQTEDGDKVDLRAKHLRRDESVIDSNIALEHYAAGDVVILHGLKQDAFNGKTGVVLKGMNQAGRYPVRVSALGKSVKLKPSNLRRLNKVGMDFTPQKSGKQKALDILIQRCIMIELEESKTVPEKLMENYGTLMLAYMTKGETKSAQFVWKRIPKAWKKVSYLKGIWELGRCLLLKDRKTFFSTLDKTKWPTTLVPFVDDLRSSTQLRMAQFIQKAYSSISARKCMDLLGLKDSKELDKFAKSAFWTYNVGDEYVNPAVLALSNKNSQGLPLSTLREMSSCIARFEIS